MIFRKGSPCDSTSLQTYALINRLRTLCAERFEALDLERKKVRRVGEAQHQVQAQHDAELQAAREAQRQAEAEIARLAEAQSATQARLLAEVEASREARRQADEQLRLEAHVAGAALVKAAADTARYETQVRELAALIDGIQRSHSWRLTRPLRLAAISLRDTFGRLRQPPASRE
jgi:fused signal recognition particle receptor